MKQKLPFVLFIGLLSALVFYTCKDDELPEVTGGNKIELTLTEDSTSYVFAQLTCALSDLPNFTIEQHGFCWDTIAGVSLEKEINSFGNLTNQNFQKKVEGLLPNKTYYIKAYIQKGDIVIYSNELAIHTKDARAIVTTNDIAVINGCSAKVGGEATSFETAFPITQRGVCWDKTQNPTINNSVLIMGEGNGEFVDTIKTFSVSTDYYIRAYAVNSEGIVYGNEKTFTTTNGLPTVTTSMVTDIGAETAIGGGNVIDDGGFEITSKGVCWSENSNPTIANAHTNDGTGAGAGAGAFTSNLTGLTEETTYYVRAYATNENGTLYGNELSFTTSGLDGLVAYYPFNNNVQDESGNGNDATNYGATPVMDRFGNLNSAYSFDGIDDYIDLHNIEISETKNQAINIWIKSNDKGSELSYILDNSENDATYDRVTIINSSANNLHDLRISYNGSYISRGYPDYSNWEMITLCITEDYLYLYSNGVKYDSTTVSKTTLGGMLLGCINTNSGNWFKGQLDDIRIFDKALTESEIQNLYNEGGWTGPETVTDNDGNVYTTVQIGDQIWMAENLKTTHYADGTEITLVESTSAWDALGYTDKAYCYYDNSTTNKDTYGALYTWAAAMDGTASSSLNPSGVQGACPDGWHLPSDAEWTELTDYLGGTSVAGGKMKEIETTHWTSPNTGATNESGFTALPGGYRSYGGAFGSLSVTALFWSATEHDGSIAWNRYLYYNISGLTRGNTGKNGGVSVRCLKD